MENMNERSKNPSNSGSIMNSKSDLGGQNMIPKKQRVKILQNILEMNAQHNLSFNRLLWLEARFHGKLHFYWKLCSSYVLRDANVVLSRHH